MVFGIKQDKERMRAIEYEIATICFQQISQWQKQRFKYKEFDSNNGKVLRQARSMSQWQLGFQF